METLAIEVLKEWARFHQLRALDTWLTDKKRKFHRQAAAEVKLRLARVQEEKWNPTGKTFEWSEFCARYRPASGRVIVI